MNSTPYTQQSEARLVEYPCPFCRTILRTPEDGVAFKLRQWTFATCHACAPRVVNATRIVGTTVRKGLVQAGLSLVNQHVPVLAPVARALLGEKV